jgi:hypothetical protein
MIANFFAIFLEQYDLFLSFNASISQTEPEIQFYILILLSIDSASVFCLYHKLPHGEIKLSIRSDPQLTLFKLLFHPLCNQLLTRTFHCIKYH